MKFNQGFQQLNLQKKTALLHLLVLYTRMPKNAQEAKILQVYLVSRSGFPSQDTISSQGINLSPKEKSAFSSYVIQ